MSAPAELGRPGHDQCATSGPLHRRRNVLAHEDPNRLRWQGREDLAGLGRTFNGDPQRADAVTCRDHDVGRYERSGAERPSGGPTTTTAGSSPRSGTPETRLGLVDARMTRNGGRRRRGFASSR